MLLVTPLTEQNSSPHSGVILDSDDVDEFVLVALVPLVGLVAFVVVDQRPTCSSHKEVVAVSAMAKSCLLEFFLEFSTKENG